MSFHLSHPPPGSSLPESFSGSVARSITGSHCSTMPRTRSKSFVGMSAVDSRLREREHVSHDLISGGARLFGARQRVPPQLFALVSRDGARPCWFCGAASRSTVSRDGMAAATGADVHILHVLGEAVARGGCRHHPNTGRKMPSVTNVLGVLSKPALIPWAANKERELCVETADTVYGSLNGEAVSADEFRSRLDLALPKTPAHKRVSQDAIHIGNEAHAYIEWRILGELGLPRGDEPETSEPACWAVAAFEDWRQEVQLKATHAEERLYSEELDAAGSTDAICCELNDYVLAPKPRRVAAIADWKSSKKIYAEHEIQVAAYRHMAIERGLLDENAWALILRLPKTPGDGFESRLLQPSRCRVLVEVFRAARRIWQWRYADKETPR